MTLQGKVARGLFWEGFAAIAARGISFLAMLILARVLVPSHFGVVSLAMLAIESLQFFQELGFSSALIYRQSDVEDAADSAFYILIASNLLLYIIAVLAAPVVAAFFRTPDVTPVLRVLALTMVINSVGRVPVTLLSKELDFRRKIIPELIAGIGGNVLAVVLAWQGWGVWSLVWGQMLDACLRNGVVWLVCPWRPRLRFNPRIGRELFDYGKHIVGSQLLIFGITNIDDAFVGRMLGSGPLGHYGLAYKVSNLPATNITRLVTRVTFPAFSQLQNETIRLRSAYFRVVHYVSLLAFPVAVATVIFAADFVHTVIGSKWAPAIVPIQLLGIYGLLRSVAANMGPMFQAGGKPQWLFYIALWRLITMAVLLYPAIRWQGIVGVSALSAVVSIVDFFISAALVNRIIQAKMIDHARLLLPILILSIAAGLIGRAAQSGLIMMGLRPLFAMLSGGGVMIVAYAALTWWRDAELRQQAGVAWRSFAARRLIPRLERSR
jgi:O-antigen/teichoic acid export membrane protein